MQQLTHKGRSMRPFCFGEGVDARYSQGVNTA